jgi:hypothetical protein
MCTVAKPRSLTSNGARSRVMLIRCVNLTNGMEDNERETLERLHRECTTALGKLLEEGEEMCRVLTAIESHPASSEQRRAIMEQRIRENAAHVAYDSARQALFKRAGWGG